MAYIGGVMRLPLVSVSLGLCLVTASPEVAVSGVSLIFAAARRRPEQPRQAPSSEYIRGGQRALKEAGYDPGIIDGQVGPSTRKALRRFQKAHGLPLTGEFDTPTLIKLLDRSLRR
jgi:peptidoglycan hydrolase-like protein with peptidoglycan-binding domain